jgi:hypothetical protein
MRLLDVNHPFFLPRWRRLAVFLFCLAWAAFEWVAGSPIWGAIATGLAAYSFYALILVFDPERVRRGEERDPRG